MSSKHLQDVLSVTIFCLPRSLNCYTEDVLKRCSRRFEEQQIFAGNVAKEKSKGISDKSIKPPSTSDNSLNPGMTYIAGAKTQVKFDGSSLKQDRVTITPKTIINFYIVHEVNIWPFNLNSKFALLNCLFGAINLTTIADPHKHSHSGYGIGFDKSETFSLSDNCGSGKNVIIFGEDNSSSVHGDNYIYIYIYIYIYTYYCMVKLQHKGQRLDYATLNTKAEYSINFSKQKIKKKIRNSIHILHV